MLQRLLLDRLGLAAYLAAGVMACRTAPGPLVPVAAAPVTREQVAAWVQPTVPTNARLLRFKWLFRDERSSAGGRGSARIAPPDSLRFDIAGPFGSGASAAAVVAESALWVRPEDALQKLVPNYPLLWALLGVARPPDSTAELRGLEQGGTIAWQYVQGGDTVEYVRTKSRGSTTDGPSKLTTQVRQRGKVIGRAETTIGPDGVPTSARLTIPEVPARLDLTFTATTRIDSFAPDVWAAPPAR